MASVFILFGFLPNVAKTEIILTESQTEQFLKITTPPIGVDQIDRSEPFRWQQKKIKIAIYVEGTDKQGIFNQLNDEFKADLDIFQEETGTQLILGLWTDNTPPSDMFILIGSQEQLLAKAEYLNRRFDLEGISDQLKEKARNGHALCESAVTLGENETILRAIIIVDVGRKPNYCIRRQLMVAFGLFGDLSEKDDSILAIRPTVVRPLTDLDRLFLKNLYQ